MTPEERFTKLEEAMLVNSSMVVRLEQNMDRLEQNLSRLEQSMDRGFAEVRTAQMKTEQSLQSMNAGMLALFEHMEQFIQGRQSNGHKQ
jgi:phage shock protein A